MKRLGCSRSMIARLEARGKLAGVQGLGKQKVFSLQDVENFEKELLEQMRATKVAKVTPQGV